MRGLIFCAGLGTRLRPITDKIPKPMVKVGGKPVLEHLVDHLNRFGISEIIVNLHYKPECIYKHFGTRLLYSYEPELLGEKRTEMQLSKWLGEEYLIMNGDTLTDVNIDEMKTIALRNSANVFSYDGGVYTGIAIKNIYHPTEIKKDFHCYWQDIGTPEGLKRAREYYAKKKSSNLS